MKTPCKLGHAGFGSTTGPGCLMCDVLAKLKQAPAVSPAPAKTPKLPKPSPAPKTKMESKPKPKPRGVSGVPRYWPMTQAAAQALGLEKYKPLAPCPNGHALSLFYSATGECLECRRKKQKARN